jgi:hypothetical protein
MVPEAWQIGDHWEEECAEDAGADQHRAKEDGEREYPCEEEASRGDGKHGEHKDVEQVGEQQVPLVNRRSHDEEGVHHKEVVVANLRPKGTRIRHGWKSEVVDKIEEKRQNETG